ncbi:transposase [Brucella endophytica]|uniref:transposase n=1 Tax=Brucella endophytica TaxID=1963359 RepID=UPI0035BC29A7
MRQPARPFIVEVKKKRGLQKQTRSIWADVDLSAFAAETANETPFAQLLDHPVVDSSMSLVNAATKHKSFAEHHMADPQETGAEQIALEATAKAEAPKTKEMATRPSKAKAESRPSVSKKAARMAEASTVAVRSRRKLHSPQERAQILSDIEQSVGGGQSIKSAAKEAGISEQTYYQWKKTAAPAAAPVAALVSENNDLIKDLLALEEENKRLKSLLAERLRKENAELRKKLGLE